MFNFRRNFGVRWSTMRSPYSLTPLDERIIGELGSVTGPNVLELSRRLQVARNTVQAHLDRMSSAGVIDGYGAHLDLAALGYTVLAFTTLEISQNAQDEVLEATLRAIPEILEVHGVTGPGDMLCRVVAQNNEHLHTLLKGLTQIPGIVRATTALVLTTPVSRIKPPAPIRG
jgi:DNA-binding Lrp family transcriptional regulator